MTSVRRTEVYRELEDRLRARRGELRQAIQSGLQAMGEERLARDIGDVGDDGLASWIQDLQEVDLQRDTEELRDIEQALERIHAGTYGYCVDCGDEVAVARLRAYPTAKRCLECQELHERRGGARA
ncbi:TraR/DksA family transcriptional regulator [Aquisalimonas lutea]|uniref:TraR/DksA family transcriptional regulator n=1 Tax=Aquisalimonas lutea TaxID=1327750 RepID=UPI0025B2E3BC|nr:TraR/DksA family transcriptional regulator [Aquisalimonas lutea]MDN3517348.1 TraR/DksA family transcriptional regulator [Aquisalimonas lutea]